MREHPVHLGELTELVELRSRTLTGDGTGGSTAVWTLYATVWAHCRPASGGESQEAMRTEAKARYTIVIRNRDDIKESDSVTWAGRDLNIRMVHRRGPRDLYLTLECELGARK